MKRASSIVTALFAASLLSACAASGDKYPSLAIRDVERVQGQFEDGGAPSAPSPAPAPPSGEILANLAQLQTEARAAHAEFVAATPRSSRMVTSAQGAASASNSWIAAQVALADLESKRSRTAVSLGHVDALYAQATVEGRSSDAIGNARDAITSLVADEDVTLAALRGQLPN